MFVGYSYLPRQFKDCDPILEDIKKLVISGDLTLGKDVEKFEASFAELIGSKYAIGVNSGTDALFLSLKAQGIGDNPNDEVITTANTFVATAGAIETAGAKIVFVDCNEKYVMDVSKVEAAITPNTKAIMPVHYSGQPVNMIKLVDIAKKHNLPIVEDACCAIDAVSNAGRCGTIGITGAFSMHPLKNLNVWGDAGVITTSSEEIRDRLILLRNHGMKNRDEYTFYAYNSRLDSLQAVVGNHCIKNVKWVTDKRIEIAERIREELKDLSEFITFPPSDGERRVYHMFMMLVEKRDELDKFLQDNEIESKIHYPTPLHLQPASKKLGYKLGDFPVAEAQAKSIISLPAHQHLTDDEVNFTIEKVREFYTKL